MSRIIFTTLFLSLGTLAVQAQQSTPSTELDEVTVTANRVDQKLSQTGKVVTVLTDSVLQKYSTQSVGELLSRQAGFMIVGAQDPLGAVQSIFLRGASSGNTLVLLDGMPVYDPSGTTNTFDLNLLSVGECERIEILRGAQSTLYGSDAVAGVINIFTKKEGKRALGGSATLQGGSYGTFRGTAAVNGSSDKGYFNVQYTRLRSDGFSAAHDRTGNQNFDNDGFWQDNVLANAGYQLNSKLLLKVRGLYSKYKTELDGGPFADQKDYTATNSMKMIGTGLEYSYRTGKLTVNYGVSQFQRNFLDDTTAAPGTYVKSSYGGVTHYAEVFNSLKINDWFQLVVGTDLRTQNTDQTYVSYSSFGPYVATPIGKDTANTTLWSAYATGLFRIPGGFSLELGGRYNNHSLYGNNFTYSINPSYLINDQLKAFANLASGFRAPSLYQLYSPYGNKALKPENSQSFEAGLQWFSKDRKSNIRALYFDRTVKNLIVYQSLSRPPYGRYLNFDKQHDKGFEVEAQTSINQLVVSGNMTYVTGQITQNLGTRDTTYNNLIRRPKVIVNLTAGYQITPSLFASASIRSVGDRNDQFYNSETFRTELVTLKAYTTFDIYAEYRVKSFLKVYGDVRNLFDEQYFDAYGYNTRGRNFNIGVRAEF